MGQAFPPWFVTSWVIIVCLSSALIVVRVSRSIWSVEFPALTPVPKTTLSSSTITSAPECVCEMLLALCLLGQDEGPVFAALLFDFRQCPGLCLLAPRCTPAVASCTAGWGMCVTSWPLSWATEGWKPRPTMQVLESASLTSWENWTVPPGLGLPRKELSRHALHSVWCSHIRSVR